MKSVISSVAFVACFSLSASVFAQGRGQAGGPSAGHGGGLGHGANTRTETRADIGQKISEHPKLAAKLQSLLPAGTNLEAAAGGFKNMGQFVAAVHVSHNLNIPFDQLKEKMVTDHKSLGGAIHELRPDMTKDAANGEAQKAETQAK
jgi:hypothetical protein